MEKCPITIIAKFAIRMSGIQLGEKQITLEDCDAIVFDKVPVVVDPSFVTKVDRLVYFSKSLDSKDWKGKVCSCKDH